MECEKISCQASVAIWCTELTGGKSRATCRRLGHCARSSVQDLSRNMKNMKNIGISYWFTLAVTKCIKMWNLETLSEASRQKFSNMCVSFGRSSHRSSCLYWMARLKMLRKEMLLSMPWGKVPSDTKDLSWAKSLRSVEPSYPRHSPQSTSI